MKEIWSDYLDQLLVLEDLHQLIVYTDKDRFWLADPLLDLGEQVGLHPKVSLIEELSEEEIIEIRQSFSLLSDKTLLVGIFSDRNPNIEGINQIFHPFNSALGYPGYSILTQFQFPNPYFYHFMSQSIGNMSDREEELRNVLIHKYITGESKTGSYMEMAVGNFVTYPYNFSNNRHVLFPSGEIVAEVESIDGTIVVDRTIGPYVSRGELIDPFGKSEHIEVLIEDSYIVEIKGNEALVDRLEQIDNIKEIQIDTISFGVYDYLRDTGLIDVDRLSTKTCTLSNPSEFLEFNFTLDDLFLGDK
jgi:hypothetical protein